MRISATKSFMFSAGSLCFAAGVFIESRFNVYGSGFFLVVAVLASAFALSFYLKRTRLSLFWFLALTATLGIARVHSFEQLSEFTELYGSKAQLTGLIAEDVDDRSDKQLLSMRPEGFNQKILITTTKVQEFKYGDIIVAEGKLKEPENFSDFNYQGYLERYGVYAVMQYPKILILKSGKGHPVKGALLSLKGWFVGRVKELMPPPQNDLLLGILIGAKKSLPPDLVEQFSLTGTSHIVAISGFNISIIIIGLGYSARLLGRRAVFYVSLVCLLAFAVLTGASASVVRATVMGLLLLIAQNIGRQYRVIPAMLFAAALMLAHNPFILYNDIGFQLSFAATLGIVLFMPPLEQLTEAWPKLWKIKSIFLATMAAIISTMPLILLYFGTLSLVAPAANIFVLPFIPAAMLFGFLSIIPFFGPGFAFVANLILSYVLAVIKFFAEFEFSSVEVAVSSWICVLLYLGVLAMYLAVKYLAGKKRQNKAVDATYSLW
jgi:competence protein ComEC